MIIKKRCAVLSLLLFGSTMIRESSLASLNNVDYESRVKEELKSVLEKEFYQDGFVSQVDYQKSFNYNNNSSILGKMSKNSFDAYSINGVSYVPYAIPGYADFKYSTEDFLREKLYYDIHDKRFSEYMYYADIGKEIEMINGSKYDYQGDIRKVIGTTSKKYYIYYRNFTKKHKEDIYENWYKHKYRGNKWYNKLIVKYETTNTRYANSISNYDYLGYEVVNKKVGVREYETITKTEFSDWCTKAPFRWAWDPEWKEWTNVDRYMLFLDHLEQWNDYKYTGYVKLPKVSIKKGNSVGLRLTQWNGISNLWDEYNYESTFNYPNLTKEEALNASKGSRTDYFFFDCDKVFASDFSQLYDDVDHLADEIYAFLEPLKRIGVFFNIFNVVKYIVKILKIIGTKANYALGIVSFIWKLIKSSYYDIPSENYDGLLKSLELLQQQLDERKMDEYKYCMFRVSNSPVIFESSFFDLRNTSHDDENYVSLKYKDNTYNWECGEKYSNNSFKDLYGYPEYVNSFGELEDAIQEIIVDRKTAPASRRFGDLVNSGVYDNIVVVS